MSYLVAKPKDTFSRDETQVTETRKETKYKLLCLIKPTANHDSIGPPNCVV